MSLQANVAFVVYAKKRNFFDFRGHEYDHHSGKNGWTHRREIACEIQAIKLNYKEPFTWASGWKSPIYCDNRLALSYPPIRSYIRNSLVGVIRETFPDVECIAGVATAGVPQGAMVADALELPYVYVRPKPKDHGMTNLIEAKGDERTKKLC
ncbi:MAG: hypothetical protein WDO15_22940 [Bacteroidota bacterium]